MRSRTHNHGPRIHLPVPAGSAARFSSPRSRSVIGAAPLNATLSAARDFFKKGEFNEETVRMKRIAIGIGTLALASSLALARVSYADSEQGGGNGQGQGEQGGGDDEQGNGIRHVLLISIDGMHALDFINCTKGLSGVKGGTPFCPNLAGLATHGVSYLDASTSKPSDSFPGLMAIVTGGSPRSVGAFYDVAFDR